LAAELDAPLAAAHVLINRGIDSAVAARRFLEPSLEQLHDPFLLRDVDRAVERIERAVGAGERILVQGDYDVDGITATFVLTTALRDLGAEVHARVPHRTRDGYGLSVAAVDQAAALGCSLIVTVDCGITATHAVEHASGLGIETVVTDHHEPGPRLPAAVAVVDPHRLDCPYPFKSLAGVGVTFKLVEALLERRGQRRRASEFLDVVALGTIADVVPLVGENRALARLGLESLSRTSRPGLRALIEVSGLAGKRITGGQAAFMLAPRMNAAGRMGHAEQALRLLLARDAGAAAALAESLDDDNRRRRALDEAVAREAGERVPKELGWPRCASILLWSEAWHPGVLGIVASRLVERFRRPTVLVALEGRLGRGSGRSVPGVDLTRVLDGCADLLETYGGHAFAAGMVVSRDQLPALRERLEQLVGERFDPELAAPCLEVDADVTLAECGPDLVGWLERLGPHGLDNPEPVYRATVSIESVSQVGGGKHLRLGVRDATGAREAIGFGMASRAEALVRSGRCELAFVPEHNEWMGETRVQLRLRELRVP
jgi:single-stranded-DNA-specific exonuclease